MDAIVNPVPLPFSVRVILDPAVMRIVSSSPADASNFRSTLLPLAEVIKS